MQVDLVGLGTAKSVNRIMKKEHLYAVEIISIQVT
jgi:hypothetical protein